jgi:Flp pilus assembly secretin CpaC
VLERAGGVLVLEDGELLVAGGLLQRTEVAA